MKLCFYEFVFKYQKYINISCLQRDINRNLKIFVQYFNILVGVLMGTKTWILDIRIFLEKKFNAKLVTKVDFPNANNNN